MEKFLESYGLGIGESSTRRRAVEQKWKEENEDHFKTLDGLNFKIKNVQVFKNKFDVSDKYDVLFDMFKNSLYVKIFAKINRFGLPGKEYQTRIGPVGAYLTYEKKLERVLEGKKDAGILNINEAKMMEMFEPGSWIKKKSEEIKKTHKEFDRDENIKKKLTAFVEELEQDHTNRG